MPTTHSFISLLPITTSCLIKICIIKPVALLSFPDTGLSSDDTSDHKPLALKPIKKSESFAQNRLFPAKRSMMNNEKSKKLIVEYGGKI